jgi:hypothetical protein
MIRVACSSSDRDCESITRSMQQLNRMYDYLLAVGGEGEENGDVEELEGDAKAVDGEDEKTVGLHEGHAVEHPEQAVEERAHIRHARVFLRRSLPRDLVERRPAAVKSIDRSIDRSIHRSIDPSIHQSINRSIHRSIGQSVNRSIILRNPLAISGAHPVHSIRDD